ncbi:MAG: OPT/YSL family transporter [Actinomycetia bacterium]|nr:OPT/YSL family transporter [Actinomycetes bacterium]
MTEPQRPFREQFTARGLIIGLIGCVIITSSSIYVALKLGALPWPIFFVVLLALFSLKLFSRLPGTKPTNINEASVSASVMSAGAMVAGGLAFTVPGIWIMLGNTELAWWKLLVCALGGVGMGIVACALFRTHFIQKSALPYPVGQGAAETLQAGDGGGRKAVLLFSAVGVAGFFTFLRDGLRLVPPMLGDQLKIPGVAFGVYASPMALAMGFMIGSVPALVWVIGGVIGSFGVVVGGPALLGWSLDFAQDVRVSLGIGLMIGCGVGIALKEVLPRAKKLFAPLVGRNAGEAIVPLRWAPFLLAAIVLVLAFVAGFGLLASLLLVLLTWLVVTMAAQCTGQAGMNPMEVFGVIVLLVCGLAVNLGGVEAFLVAATATVACGFVGDLMNDFKAGALLGTSPRAQWIGVSIGGVLGAVVGTAIILLFVTAYGASGFGPDGTFVAAQATAVASMVGGIPNLPVFLAGLAIGALAYTLKAPVITLGLGVYLPFYLTLAVAIGAAVRFVVSKIAPRWSAREDGMVLASGLLGGESIVGVIQALVVVISSGFGLR